MNTETTSREETHFKRPPAASKQDRRFASRIADRVWGNEIGFDSVAAWEEEFTASPQRAKDPGTYFLRLATGLLAGVRDSDSEHAAMSAAHAMLKLPDLIAKETALRLMGGLEEMGSTWARISLAGELLLNDDMSLRDPARGWALLQPLLDGEFSTAETGKAHYLAGLAYLGGSGVDRDTDAARKEFMLAALDGEVDAYYMVGGWCEGRTAGASAIPQPKVAAHFYTLGVNGGCTDCAVALALLHLTGELHPADQPLALSLLDNAARRGDERAQNVLDAHARGDIKKNVLREALSLSAILTRPISAIQGLRTAPQALSDPPNA